LLPDGHYLYCPNGGHMAMYDDQATYMAGVIGFLRDVDAAAPRAQASAAAK
jgi:proline iminopeptidase